MGYQHETERLDLGDGHWTVMFKELKHGTERQVGEIGQKAFVGKDGVNPSLQLSETDGETQAAVIGGVEIDLKRFDSFGATNLMILLQTVEWSLGDISQEVLDDLPARLRAQIAAWMKERYVLPLARSGGDGSESSSS